jgi:hypothetical protein
MLPLRTKQAFDLLTSKEICDEIYKKICVLIKIKIKEGMCTLLICSFFYFLSNSRYSIDNFKDCYLLSRIELANDRIEKECSSGSVDITKRCHELEYVWNYY